MDQVHRKGPPEAGDEPWDGTGNPGQTNKETDKNAAQLSRFSGIFDASSGGYDETEGSTTVRARLASIQKFMIYEF